MICTSQPVSNRARAFATAISGSIRRVCVICPSLDAWIVKVMSPPRPLSSRSQAQESDKEKSSRSAAGDDGARHSRGKLSSWTVVKIFGKLPTDQQLFWQNLGGLKLDLCGERCILFSKEKEACKP